MALLDQTGCCEGTQVSLRAADPPNSGAAGHNGASKSVGKKVFVETLGTSFSAILLPNFCTELARSLLGVRLLRELDGFRQRFSRQFLVGDGVGAGSGPCHHCAPERLVSKERDHNGGLSSVDAGSGGACASVVNDGRDMVE